MNSDINEQAKAQVEAGKKRRLARERLRLDGANSTAAFQRRLRVFVQEKNLPEAEYRKLLFKRVMTGDILPFCEKYKVSLDWLLGGELAGLHRMTQEAKAQQAETVEAQRQEIIRLFLALPAGLRSTALAGIREIAERSRSNG
jgi:hypothetical protein